MTVVTVDARLAFELPCGLSLPNIELAAEQPQKPRSTERFEAGILAEPGASRYSARLRIDLGATHVWDPESARTLVTRGHTSIAHPAE